MKKGLKIGIGICLIVVLGLSFAGCIRKSAFNNLQKAFADSVDVVESLDEVDEADLAEENVNMNYDRFEPALNFGANEVVRLSDEDTNEEENELTVSQKVDYILDSLKDIKDKQIFVNQEKVNLRIQIKDIKAKIKTFKESDLELTEEEEIIIEGWTDEIYETRANIKSTIGKVYLKMKNLRGHYNLQDIDYVIATLDEVNKNMDIRKSSLISLQELAVEVDSMVTERLNEIDTETDTQTENE